MKGQAKSRGSLRSEIVASVTLVAAVAVVLAGMLILQALHADGVNMRILELQRTGSLLAAGLQALAGKGFDPEALRRDGKSLLAMAAGQDGIEVLWVDQAQKVIWGKTGPEDEELKGDLTRALQWGIDSTRIMGEGGLWPLWGIRTIVHTRPVLAPEGGRPWGGLRLQAPAEGAWEALQRRGWFLLLYVGLLMGVLVLFGSYLLSKNVVRPLQRLMQVSESIALGQHSSISWEGYPLHEVGRLAQALRKMSESLQEKQAALEQKIQDLEAANRALMEAQQALVRSEKLACVGRLAAGVAHEIGNPIGSILGYMELLLQEAGDPTQRDCLARVKGEAERIQRTVRALVEVGRPSGQRWELVDLKEIVDEILAVLQAHPGMRGVKLSWDPPQGPHQLWAHPDQIRQVLLNLMLNAMDSLGGKGCISVRVGRADRLPKESGLVSSPRRKDDPADIDFSPFRKVPPVVAEAGPGPFVFVQVEDTGSGIPPGHLERLFEPFFTTKEPGKGTGLGLTVCFGIVESYGGKIQVQSEPGKGSIFTVFFPVGRQESISVQTNLM